MTSDPEIQLTFTLTPEEYVRYSAAAELDGIPLGTWLRHLCKCRVRSLRETDPRLKRMP